MPETIDIRETMSSRVSTTSEIGLVALVGGSVHSLYSVGTDPVVGEIEGSGGVLVTSDMPTLEALLNHSQVAYTVFQHEAAPSDSVAIHRLTVAWVLLWMTGVVWGIAVGISFAYEDFFVHPAIAVAGLLFTGALVATAMSWSRSRAPSGSDWT